MSYRGPATEILSENSFTLERVDYMRDKWNGRCYVLDTPYGNSRAAREGGLVRRRISKASYEDAYKKALVIVNKWK